MSRREQTWEVLVMALSWIIALVALVCLGCFAAADAAKRCWERHGERFEKMGASQRLRRQGAVS